MAPQRFTATIQPEGGSAYIDLDFDVPAAFGTRGRVSVKGRLAGHEFRSSISRRHGRWYLVVNHEMRRSFGIGPGDVVEVLMDRDDEPRTIDAPQDLHAAIVRSDAATSRWEAMSYSHRKQFVVWVEGAKRPATRQRRIAQAIPMIERGERRT